MLVSNLEVSGSIIIHGGAITGSVTGSLFGEFSGSGANLYDISASAIIGLNLSRISSGSVTASIDEENGFVVKSELSGSTFTGSINLISGSYSGSGANLSGIPASAIVGLSLNTIATGSVTASVDVTHGFVVKSEISGSTFTGSINLISGSYSGSGANLFDISASAIKGLSVNKMSTGSVTSSVDQTEGFLVDSQPSGSLFKGKVTFSGSVTITDNLVVQGSSSFTYVTASQILVDQNTITVFTSGSDPFQGGYKVADTSSWDGTGSFTNESALLYNTVDKYWSFRNDLVVSGTLEVSQSITSSGLLVTGSSYFTGSVGISGSLNVSGTIFVTGSITGSLQGTASYADVATYAKNAPRRFIVPDETYVLAENFEMYVYDLYNFGTLVVDSGSLVLPFGTGSIRNDGSIVTTFFYNAGIVINNGAFQIISHSI